MHQYCDPGTCARAAPCAAGVGAGSGTGGAASAGGSARMGGASGASRLLPLHAAWGRVSSGAGRVRENSDPSGGRLFSAARPENAERAAILHRWRPLDRVSARGAAARAARSGAAISGLFGSGAELHLGIHLHGGKNIAPSVSAGTVSPV